MNIEIPIQHDPWMVNGIETLYRLLTDLNGCQVTLWNDSLEIKILDDDLFIKDFSDRIKSMQDSIIFFKKEDENGLVRYIRKDYVLLQYGKAENRNILKEKIFLDPEERLTAIFSNLDTGNKICIFCGRSFKKKIDNVKQAVYPFTTKIRSLSGVRTLKDNFDNLCPICYLIGTLEWLDEGIVYRSFLGPSSRKYSLMLLPFEMDLKRLHEAKNHYIETLDGENQSVSNVIKIRMTKEGEKRFPTEGEYTTVIKFFEEFIDRILHEYDQKELEYDGLLDEIERIICKEWVSIDIPSGTVKNIKVNSLILKDDVLQLFVRLQNNSVKIYNDIIDKIGMYDKKNKLSYDDTINFKNNAAKLILEDNFRKFSRMFLPGRNLVKFFGNLTDIDKLIFYWRLTKMNVEEELVNLKGASKAFAKLTKNHASILYAMDKAKTKADFFRAFEQASKRLIGLKTDERKGVYPHPIENVADLIYKSDEDKWKIIRDALIVYTSINYSKEIYRETMTSKEGDNT